MQFLTCIFSFRCFVNNFLSSHPLSIYELHWRHESNFAGTIGNGNVSLVFRSFFGAPSLARWKTQRPFCVVSKLEFCWLFVELSASTNRNHIFDLQMDKIFRQCSRTYYWNAHFQINNAFKVRVLTQMAGSNVYTQNTNFPSFRSFLSSFSSIFSTHYMWL